MKHMALCLSMFATCILLCWNVSVPAVEHLRYQPAVEQHLPGSKIAVMFDVENTPASVRLQLVHDLSENYVYDPGEDTVILSQEITAASPQIREELLIPADLPDGAYFIRAVEGLEDAEPQVRSVYFVLRQGKVRDVPLSELFQKSSLTNFNPPKNSYPGVVRAGDPFPAREKNIPDYMENCMRASERRTHIWIIDTETHMLMPITKKDNCYQAPAASPTGERFAYVAGIYPARKIVSSDLTASQDSMILTEELEGDSVMPVWSPEGTHIAFLADTAPAEEAKEMELKYNLWVMDRTGENRRPVTSHHYATRILGWSSDSANILISSQAPQGSREQFFLIDVQTGESLRIPVAGTWGSLYELFEQYLEGTQETPELFAHSKNIVYSLCTRDKGCNLFMENRETDQFSQLSDDFYQNLSPSQVPGTNMVVFVSNRPLNQGSTF